MILSLDMIKLCMVLIVFPSCYSLPSKIPIVIYLFFIRNLKDKIISSLYTKASFEKLNTYTYIRKHGSYLIYDWMHGIQHIPGKDEGRKVDAYQ